jgi:ribosomal protein L11 methyltransferase
MPTPPVWWISITTSPESEEAVAAALERWVGQAPVSYTDAESRASTVSAYPPQLPAPARALRRGLGGELKAIERLGLDIGPARLAIRKLHERDWAHAWKRHFKPVDIGGVLLLKPSWSRRAAKKGQSVIVLDPGLSFGTGRHPTTSFCLREIVRLRAQTRPSSFLDVGTGSGVLAIAAAKLGYRPVRGVDVDPISVRVARSNARRNRATGVVKITQDDFRRLPPRARRKYDLVCANLTADLLVNHAKSIRGFLRTGGRLVLAGILDREFDAVATAYAKKGMALVRLRVEGGWRSATFQIGR